MFSNTFVINTYYLIPTIIKLSCSRWYVLKGSSFTLGVENSVKG